jgi:hypothetical protein
LFEIEKGKPAMQWNIVLALLSVFRENSSTSGLLEHFGIYMDGKFIAAVCDDQFFVKIKDCFAQGVEVDRRALYCYRLAVHYADRDGQLPEEKRNWRDWKD